MASITGKPNPSYSDGYTIVWQDWYRSTMVSWSTNEVRTTRSPTPSSAAAARSGASCSGSACEHVRTS